MDEFTKNLADQLRPQNENVTLERILKFYEFAKSSNWTGTISNYRGMYVAIINTHGNGVFDGTGNTIGAALDNILTKF